MADEAHERIAVSASPDRCREVAVDFANYPNWARDIKQVSVIEHDNEGRGSQVEYRVAGLGRNVRYVLEYDYSQMPNSFSWHLVEGDVLKKLDGRYGFEAQSSGTRVTYDLVVDISIPLPGLLKRRAAGMIVGTALRELKREVEK